MARLRKKHFRNTSAYHGHYSRISIPPRRDARVITKAPALPRRFLLPLLIKSSGEDLRRYHPNGSNRPLLRLDGRRAVAHPSVRFRLRLKTFYRPQLSRSNSVRPRLQRRLVPSLSVRYRFPADAVVCAKRHVRREVIFAKGFGGRGGQRPPRHNPNSNVSC